jgi:cysteine desulfurase/selenocysteine lyase
MGFFNKRQPNTMKVVSDFEYLDSRAVYLDSACQTLRPQPVIDAMAGYFRNYNACGGRVKYEWGTKVDRVTEEARKQVLALVGKPVSDYAVAFTLNTTYGINLILSQLPRRFERVVTSEIEHNSVFLPTMSAAKRLGVPRAVLKRSLDGSLEYGPDDIKSSVAVLNTTSNIDGRTLRNGRNVAEDVHSSGGILILDAAQSLGHDKDLVRSIDFDALAFSGHKLYGPSLGVMVIRKSLLEELDIQFIGGGMVEDVLEQEYSLVTAPEDLPARLEPGLQDFAGIAGLSAALKWLSDYRPEGMDQGAHQAQLSQYLFGRLSALGSVLLINQLASPILSFYSEKIDAHRLAIYLSAQNIMVRSGYFCCHYYLKNQQNYPPLLRVSLGLHSTRNDAEAFIDVLEKILNNT